MWWDASSSTPAPTRTVVNDIGREDMVEFFRDLINAIRLVFERIPDLEAEMKTELEKQNIALTDQEFRQAVLEQLYQVMNQIEMQIVKERKWSKESMELAFQKYEQDEEILALQEELRQLMQSVFPKPSTEIPEHLTEDKTLTILNQLVEGMEMAMRETLNHAKSEGISDPTKALEEFQSLYLEQVQAFSEKMLRAHNITNEEFTAALQKYHTESVEFVKQVETIYAKQAEAFRKMGLEVHE